MSYPFARYLALHSSTLHWKQEGRFSRLTSFKAALAHPRLLCKAAN